MSTSRFLAALALIAATMAGGLASDAAAQSRRLQNSCDQICFNRPNAQCYQACFASRSGGAISTPRAKLRPVLPLGVVNSQNDWRSVVYNTAGPGRGGNAGGGNAGGGGGGKAK